MSVYWNLKRKSKHKYIVIQHPLKIQKNTSIQGIKFCGGFGIVAEGSKEYFAIKKMPMFKKMKELPLSFLKKAGFRLADVKLVFGYDVYYHYLDALGLDSNMEKVTREVKQPFENVKVTDLIEANQKEELDNLGNVEKQIFSDDPNVVVPELTADDIIAVHRKQKLCVFVNKDGTVCKGSRSLSSPSGYCFGHIKYDTERLTKK